MPEAGLIAILLIAVSVLCTFIIVRQIRMTRRAVEYLIFTVKKDEWDKLVHHQEQEDRMND